jgi:antitoxin CptB
VQLLSDQLLLDIMNRATRLKRLKFRSSHRGTREADMMIGDFFDAYGARWDENEIGWFEFLEEQDVDIMAWAMGILPIPPRWDGDLMRSFCQLDYLKNTA